MYNAEIYCGKTGNQREVGQAYRVAMQMVKPLLNCGRTLFTDNFYTSPQLAADLHESRTYLVGTVRSHRSGIPKDFVGKSYQDVGAEQFEPRSGKSVEFYF